MGGGGVETGIMKYEKAIISICAYGSCHFFQKKKFSPFLDASVGYGLSLAKSSIGSLHLSVGVGTEYEMNTKIKLRMSLIYQNQALTRILKHSNEYASTEFQERLTHNSIGVKVGFVF